MVHSSNSGARRSALGGASTIALALFVLAAACGSGSDPANAQAQPARDPQPDGGSDASAEPGPAGKTVFSASQQPADKIDLLFAIDNSASMGDKQSILADAVPDLLAVLVRPRCVDAGGKPTGELADPLATKQNHYGCPSGTEPEFKPVTDMHVGIVSSSLGNLGGNVCDPGLWRTNDRAHLLATIASTYGAPTPVSITYATYAPAVYKAPCAKFGTFSTP
jgi:hypothetical protein